MCKPQSCTGDIVTGASSCNGAGACITPASTPCAPYGCDGDKCGTTCTTDPQCAAGYVCRAGKCAPKSGGDCTPDGLASIAPDGTKTNCTVYKCKGTTCGTSCGDTNDCLAGYNCNTDSHTCVATSNSGTDSGGGCSVGSAGSRQHSSPGVFGVGALIALASSIACRRRRARSV